MIKQLKTKNLNDILSFENKNEDVNHYSKNQLNDILKNKQYYNIGIFMKNKLIAYLLTCVNDSSIDVLKIYVINEKRRMGFAKKLLHKLIKAFPSKPVYIEVLSNNVNAISLYKLMNFKVTHIRKDYFGKYMDALVMVH